MLLLLYLISLRRIGTPAKERYYNLNSNYHMTGKIQHVQVGEYLKKKRDVTQSTMFILNSAF